MEIVKEDFNSAMRGLIERKGGGADADWKIFCSNKEIIGEAVEKGVPICDICEMLRKYAGFHGARDKVSKFLDKAGLREVAVRKPAVG